jgi:hypothetical protein
MNKRQKSATLVFRVTGIILAFLGVIFMATRSHPYPVSNISYTETALFVVFLVFIHILPGLLLLLFSKFFGVWVGKDLDD